jgi:tRNA G18 (ribose-2'-O)-methylase SpoU
VEEAEWMSELWLQMKERTDPWVVLEGQQAVEAAMVNWWDIVGVVAGDHCEWTPPEWSGLMVQRCNRETLESTAGYRVHRGVLGLARQPEEVAEVHGLMSELNDESTVVVCPRMPDPVSVGALIRNAAALGAAAVIFGSESASPFHRKAVQASAGALFRIPVRVADSGQVLRCLKAGGFTLLGVSGDESAWDLADAESVGGRVALVIGAEGEGLGSFWMKACDRLVQIPLETDMDSMNMVAISAVCLWELQRLREIGLDELENL